MNRDDSPSITRLMITARSGLAITSFIAGGVVATAFVIATTASGDDHMAMHDAHSMSMSMVAPVRLPISSEHSFAELMTNADAVMHYGMALMALPVPALEEAIRKGDAKSVSRLLPGESIARRMHERSGAGDASSSFDDLLDRQTRSGEMLFLIVGDGVHQSVERFASWIEGFKALPFHLGLVELRFFSAPSVGTLVAPRTLLKTREVARHVVSVRMSAETASQVTVEMQDTMLQEGGGSITSITPIRSADLMTEDALLEKSRIETSPQGAQFLADLIKLAKDASMDFQQTRTELVLGVRVPDGRFFSLLNLPGTSLYAAQSAALHDAVGSEALKQHRQALSKLGDFYSAEALAAIVPGSGKGCLVPKYDSLEGTAAQFVNELMRFREVILATWEGTAARGDDAFNVGGASAAVATSAV